VRELEGRVREAEDEGRKRSAVSKRLEGLGQELRAALHAKDDEVG
jgi:hypothetical protein